MLQPQRIKNRKNIGIELRKTHYTLGNDRIIHLITLLYNTFTFINSPN